MLVGLPDGESAGLVTYDLGRETEDVFEPLRHRRALAVTESIIRSAIGGIKLKSPKDAQIFLPYLEAVCDSNMRLARLPTRARIAIICS
ncbi:hypothetical protein BKA67DRAFT_558481 [Truncatella angustata]|uniref:Uncharacterized protein n=1 Tax=Truncatella angustata TaxID=152316 RepID=A0A9P8UV21_9PEZI|nr:uncharacterized protein BKA67DRAFT_558481 [Truncatella angustata]KAH6658582.1 hypothetical protein BKA67DRAFT_558481 [Truncatella angustata]